MSRTLTRNWRRESILDAYNLFIGLLLVASPWLLAYAHGLPAMDAWASGALVILLSLAAIFAFSEWEEWLSLLTGLWLIVSPFVLGFTHTTAMHVTIAAGVLIAYLAALELCILHYGLPDTPHAPAA